MSAERRQDQLRLSFQNSGHPLALEDLPRIFAPYYRGEKSRSRERGGAGIGLSIVEAHVRAHGGRVGADSSGEVTAIWIELPCDSGEALLNR